MTDSSIAIPSPARALPYAIVIGTTIALASAVPESDALVHLRSSRAADSGSAPTSVSGTAPLLFSERIEDLLVSQVAGFLSLGEGWDGESAARASEASAADAILFLRAAGPLAKTLEPTLHVDGSVLLEIDSGARGVLQFRGNGSVSYALVGHSPASAPISMISIPAEIADYLRG